MAGTARGAAAIKLREVVSRLLARPEEPNPAFERWSRIRQVRRPSTPAAALNNNVGENRKCGINTIIRLQCRAVDDRRRRACGHAAGADRQRQGQGPYRGHHRRDPDQPDREPNILFGNLQKITSEQLGLSPVLMAAANSFGGVMGKMIDAQSIVVASTATNWYGHEGTILRFVFKHSIALACLVGLLVMLQAYVYPFTEMVLK